MGACDLTKQNNSVGLQPIVTWSNKKEKKLTSQIEWRPIAEQMANHVNALWK